MAYGEQVIEPFVDYGYISDIDSDEEVHVAYRNVPHDELVNYATKICAIYFYYIDEDNYKYCMCCRHSSDPEPVKAVLVHKTNAYGELRLKTCSNCRNPLYQFLPCNLCTICTR